MRDHLVAAPGVAGKGTVAGVDGLDEPVQQIISHAEPVGCEAVGRIGAKSAFEPGQGLRGSARPHQNGPAIGKVVRIARIDLERAIDLSEREIEAFPV